MFKLVWIEILMGQRIIRAKSFPDREQRFRFIMKLERSKYFDKVIEMN